MKFMWFQPLLLLDGKVGAGTAFGGEESSLRSAATALRAIARSLAARCSHQSSVGGPRIIGRSAVANARSKSRLASNCGGGGGEKPVVDSVAPSRTSLTITIQSPPRPPESNMSHVAAASMTHPSPLSAGQSTMELLVPASMRT